MPWYDADDADEGGEPSPLLPPEDRLWRHPSELGRAALPAPAKPARHGTATVALAAALAGAAATTAIMAAAGGLPSRTVERPVVEKVALTPVVSSPMLDGDRGVAAVAAHVGPAVVRLEVDGGAGSGVVIRDDGLALTSAALVRGARSIEGVLSDGRRLGVVLLGTDPVTQVAVVDLDGEGHPVAVLGTTDHLTVGAPAVVIGAARGAAGWPSAAAGVISALARQVQAPDGDWLHGMIETDAPLGDLAEGAALVDERGAVVGITTASVAQRSGRFGYATPIDVARRVATDVASTGRARHAWLGVAGDDLSLGDAAAHGVAAGALVREVSPDGPAAAAGLAPGDVVTELGGAPVSSMSQLVVALRRHAPGAVVELVYLRDGEHRRAAVSLAERP